jgi:hypothetical protein
MTKWQEMPLRPQGRPWAGINTRSGKLDDGTGQMTDASLNCIINTADRLEKRKGIIRGLDERFAGSICGLHRYTDECGREWLIVADQAGFSIRQPFSIPSFANSDAYPSDDFAAAGPVDQFFWRNTGGYEQVGGALVLRAGETAPGDLVWFKEASNFSYKVTVGWEVADDDGVALVIKNASTARLEARIAQDTGVATVQMVHVDRFGVDRILLAQGIAASSGTMTFNYARDTSRDVYRVVLDITPEGGQTSRLDDFSTITALDDADLGQGTALRLEGLSTSPKILFVQGEPI